MHGMINLPGSTTGCSLKDTRILIHKRVKETGFNYSQYEKTISVACNLCSWTKFSLYAHQDRYGLPVRSMQCEKCGLIFISPRMKEEDYIAFYSDWYRKLIDAFNGREQSEHIVRRSSEIQADQMMKFLGQYLPQALSIKTMLDIGGSTGVFADKVCKLTGAKGFIIEPNKHECKEALEKGLTYCGFSLSDCKTDRRFDLISMLRTVEHLTDISKSFEKVSKLLKPNGVFLIDIVNHTWLARHFKDKCICTKIDHIYQLTDSTIRKYFDKHKFKVIGSSSADERYISYLVR